MDCGAFGSSSLGFRGDGKSILFPFTDSLRSLMQFQCNFLNTLYRFILTLKATLKLRQNEAPSAAIGMQSILSSQIHSFRRLKSISAHMFGMTLNSLSIFFGLLSSPPFNSVSPFKRKSQFLNSSISTTLISLLAKKRPGQAWLPWPKFRESEEVVMN